MHRLADYRGRWLVLYFYPKADTPGCTRESCALRDEWLEFQRRQVAVLGVSLDAAAAQKAFAAKHGLPFPLLSDLTGRVAAAYGSVWDFAVVRFAKRHTFLIDPEGRIAKTYLKVSPERHGRELIQDLPRCLITKGGHPDFTVGSTRVHMCPHISDSGFRCGYRRQHSGAHSATL